MADARKVERRLADEGGDGRELTPTELDAKWQTVQSRLKVQLGPHAFNAWLAALRIASLKNGRLTLLTTTAYRRSHIAAHYQERLRITWRQVEPSVQIVEIIVDPAAQGASLTAPSQTSAHSSQQALSSTSRFSSKLGKPGARPGAAPRANFLSETDPDPQYTFERFVVGPSNQIAYAAAQQVAREASGNYNPLYLYSPSGFGKTHLVNAIGREAMRLNPALKVAYVPAEKFMMHFVASARDGDTMAFKEVIRSVDLLILDDLQFLCGKVPTVREFIQTFSALVGAGKRVIITADRPASKLDDIDEHTRTRLGSGLTVSMEAPDYELRLAILKRKLADRLAPERRHFVPETSLEYIAQKVDSNPRELEAALKCVTANCELIGKPISLEMTQEIVRHLVRTTDKRITIEEIQKEVSTFYGVSMRDLLSHRRDRGIVRPRQIAMYLAKELTTRSLPEIGRRFGGRDHTTVLYGVRKIADMRKENSALSDEIDLLRRMIES